MTEAKRQAVEEWAEAFIRLTGNRLHLAPEKFAKFKRDGINMDLFHVKASPVIEGEAHLVQ